MKYIILKGMMLLIALSFVSGSFTVYAHEGATHGTALEAELHDTLTETQMQTIIALLQKLIVLLKAKNEASHTAQAVHDDDVVMDAHTDAIVTEEMEIHHEEHTDAPLVETEQAEVRKLVIEVEEHNSNTHVHVRYVDKQEEMFFVDAPMSDEAGLIADIALKTGLTEAEVREAIVHTGM